MVLSIFFLASNGKNLQEKAQKFLKFDATHSANGRFHLYLFPFNFPFNYIAI